MNVLVTGGLGFIGSHTVVELINSKMNVIIVDDLSNSSITVLNNLKKIVNRDILFYEGDIKNYSFVNKIFNENKIDAVIHFAGYKAVGESVNNPLKYYRNNIDTTLTLLEVMEHHQVYNFIFSSSATVYGKKETLPIMEDESLLTTNPYGTTKLFIERILNDLYTSNNKWNITILRYFNPIGASKTGLIGENPKDIPNNLMPYILKVSINELPVLNIYGNDYNTVDGTGVRDYIHVVDLARGHVLSLTNQKDGIKIYNLGTGHGTSVLELINEFEKVNNIKINKRFMKRRAGDIDSCYADITKAYNELGFKPLYDISDMCKDAYNFQINNK